MDIAANLRGGTTASHPTDAYTDDASTATATYALKIAPAASMAVAIDAGFYTIRIDLLDSNSNAIQSSSVKFQIVTSKVGAGTVAISVVGPQDGTTALLNSLTQNITATLTDADEINATIDSTTPATIRVIGQTATVTGTTGSATAEPASTIYATHGSSVVATVLVKDQFGAAVANSSVTASVTGRNATTASVALATDATGRASYTLVDAGTAATVLTASTIVFDTALTANTSVVVNYSADRVSAVALSTPTTLNKAMEPYLPSGIML